MPLVEVTLTEGRSAAQVRDLLHALHTAVHETTGALSEHIRVIVREVPRTHWATGDVTVAELHAAAAADRPAHQSDPGADGAHRSDVPDRPEEGTR